jgi:MerR family mercuric resistance operon transcriptional regulator
VETIRYYQSRRLLPIPPKPLGGQRLYPGETVDRLRFIKHAQSLGFSLDEIATLLKLNDGTDHARARRLAEARLAEVEARAADLQRLGALLRSLTQACEHAEARKVACPIIGSVMTTDRSGSSRPAPKGGVDRVRRSRGSA